jgi:hypothetical protein
MASERRRSGRAIKWLKRILIGLGACVLVIAGLIGAAVFSLWYGNSHKSELQTLEVPGHSLRFILLTDISGFEDPAWYVYQVPVGEKPTKGMTTGQDRGGALFWNYSEAGEHYDNPRIEILKGKYLVFSRGGFHYSLYDIEAGKVLVNDESPWFSYMMEASQNMSRELPSREEMGKGMDEWVRRNLHSRIEAILNAAP